MAELRRRQPQSVDSLLQEQYLAAEEQEEVVLQLKSWHAKQSKAWSAVFAALAALLGGGCLYLAMHQVKNPWGLRHHAYFYQTASKYEVAVAEACDGISLGLTSAVLVSHVYSTPTSTISKLQRPLAYASILSASTVASWWLHLSIKAANYQEDSLFLLWRYAWLPLAPLSYMFLSFYLMWTFARTHRDIDSLKASMYELRTA